MALTPGDKLGAYEILSPLGAGGMGEVYRARDPKLGRDVAIKVLPATLAQHPDRLARFDREAKVLAAMNHPNIAVIYGLEHRAIVMELVEGPTLADRIAESALSLDESLKIAAQIADALEAAHEKGVVHRDLKPANVKVREDGTVKVLDFGLATAAESSGREDGGSANSPTLTMGATEAGVILGTAAYMSPEQASGKKADKRADIWSFGVVLYEMVTGKRLFTGETTSHVLANVLTKDPDFEKVPVQVRRLVRGCLKKDVTQRLQAMGDWRLLLDDSSQVQTAPSRSRLGWIAWIAAGVFLLAFAVLAFLHFREAPPVLPAARFDVALTEINRQYFTLSPDGRNLAYTNNEGGPLRIWIRALDSLEPHPLAGTDGATYPFWSPDGANLGFFAQGKLKKIAVVGGPAQNLCDAPTPRGGSWNRDGVIIFGNLTGGLLRVSDQGGAAQPLTKLASGNQETHRYPEFILGGKRFLFAYLNGSPEAAGIYAGSTDGAPPVRILPDQSRAFYVPPNTGSSTGYLLFVRENTLMALPFDPDKIRPTGAVVPLVEELAQNVNTGYGAFSASQNGVLLYRSGGLERTRNMIWIDRSGKRVPIGNQPQALAYPALSPDGKRAAYELGSAYLVSDLWFRDLERGTAGRFTFGTGLSQAPVWSPDGSYIVFMNRPIGANYDFYKKPANGAGNPELLLHAGINGCPFDISPDGKLLVYSETEAQTKEDLWLLPLQGEHKPQKYLDSPFNEILAQFSPDGKWMAYVSDESGQAQVYVQAVPATGEKHQISTAGGSRPRWRRRDGRELFYIAADGKLMSAPVKPGGTTFNSDPPQPVFAQPLFAGTLGPVGRDFGYQPAADGQKFLAVVPTESEAAAAPPFTVWINWQAGLKK